jgi:hypothetical protein
LIARGVTINGLAISTPDGKTSNMIESFPLDYLMPYYKHCVIGGPNAFVIAAGDMRDFEMAVRKKFIAEIAGPPGSIFLAEEDARAQHPFDCSRNVRGR